MGSLLPEMCCSYCFCILGVIVYRIVDNNPEYLMIQRKDTLGYVEFMRGKYNLKILIMFINYLRL